MVISHRMGFWEIPETRKFPNVGNLPGIPIWEIAGREKFEAIKEGKNGNFSLKISERSTR